MMRMWLPPNIYPVRTPQCLAHTPQGTLITAHGTKFRWKRGDDPTPDAFVLYGALHHTALLITWYCGDYTADLRRDLTPGEVERRYRDAACDLDITPNLAPHERHEREQTALYITCVHYTQQVAATIRSGIT